MLIQIPPCSGQTDAKNTRFCFEKGIRTFSGLYIMEACADTAHVRLSKNCRLTQKEPGCKGKKVWKRGLVLFSI